MKNYYKKFIGAIAISIVSLSTANAQAFPQSFEGSFPPTGWVIFDNAIGTVESWTTTAIAQAGAQAAYIQYENVPSGLAQDWLVSPVVAITATSNVLSFWERENYTANWGSVYNILVSTSSQTTTSSFTTVATYTENLVNPLVYKNRIINLSAYNGQNVYIAFQMVNDDGDDWLLDDIQLTGGCVTAPFAGVISGTNSTTYGNTSQYTVTPTTGNIQWLSGPSASGPWTAITGATNTPQNITAMMGGTMYLTVVASSTVGGCISDTSNVPLAVSVFFPGDDACGSVSLTIGASTTYYKFQGASVQTGEVQPPGGNCQTQYSWCNNILNNTRWFRFTAPASGHVIIQLPDFDTQLAVWKAASCSGVLSTSTATFVCANDDDPSYIANGGVQFSSYLRAGCLTPGVVYYLQADSYNAAVASDSTRIIITDGGTPLDVSFTGLNSTYCIPGAASSSLTPVMGGGMFTLNTSTVGITSFNPSTAGIGTHTITHSVSGCKTTSMTTVAATPTVTAATNNTLLCAGQSATLNANGATTYSWSSGPIGPVIMVSPTVTTTYTVTGTVGSCSSTAILTQSVSVCSGINSIPSNVNGFVIYPNPNNGVFTLQADHLPENIIITDLLGKKVFAVEPNALNTTIDIKMLHQGIYFVTVKFRGTASMVKIIIE